MIATVNAPYAEAGLISAALLDPAVALDAAGSVPIDWFQDPKNRICWGAMLRIIGRRDVPDMTMLAEELSGSGEMDAAGGMLHLGSLLDAAVTASAWQSYASTLSDRAHRSRLRQVITTADILLHGSDSAAAVQGEMERLLAAAAGAGKHRAAERFSADMDELLIELEAYGTDAALTGALSGISALDDFLGPLEPGSLTYIAARPSMGKSALMLRYALHTAIRMQRPVVVFSVESPRAEVRRRALAQEARVNMKVARKRGLQDDELARMHPVFAWLNVAPLYLQYVPGLTLSHMRSELRRISNEPAVKEAGGIALVTVDYLQLMQDPGAESRRHEVEALSRGLKQIGGEFKTAMLPLSQLSRAVEQVPDKRPQLSHLRESGMIEADADNVVLLYRPEYYFGATKDGQSLVGLAEAKVAKSRDGGTGPVSMHFEAPFTLFEDFDRRGRQ